MARTSSEIEWCFTNGRQFSEGEFLNLLEAPEFVNILLTDNVLHSHRLYNCGNNIQVPLASLYLIVKGPKNVFRLLVNHGLDLNKKDVNGCQSLYYLLKLQGVKEIFEDVFFQHWKPDPNIVDKWGKNCLTYFSDKHIDPLNDPNTLAIISHMKSPCVMKIQKSEGVKNIDLMRRPILKLNQENGSTIYGLLLIYNRDTVIVPIKDGMEEDLEVVWQQQQSSPDGRLLYIRESHKWNISLDVCNLLTGCLEYGTENKVVLTTSSGERFHGEMLVAEIGKAVLSTCVLGPLNRLFIPTTDEHIDQFKKCRITQGEHTGGFALMMSLTKTQKRLLLLIGGPDGCHFFSTTFVSLSVNQYQFVHQNGEPLNYSEYQGIVKRSDKFLGDLFRLSRLDM